MGTDLGRVKLLSELTEVNANVESLSESGQIVPLYGHNTHGHTREVHAHVLRFARKFSRTSFDSTNSKCVV